MPIYEYYCDACDEKFETLVRGDDVPSCPRCGGQELKRLLSACGFVSKGAGGETVAASAGSSACGSCSSTSCSSCGI